jgi:large conductance mechanosensitive channel
MGLMKEFKEFALQGNMVDLAVGVVIGAAFGGVVNSLVKNVMMPPLGLLTGGIDFKDKTLTLKHALDAVAASPGVPAVAAQPAVVLSYGLFIQDLISFFIIAMAIFAVIKAMNTLKKKPVAAPAVPTTKECPLCCTTIPINAKKCPNCTSSL